MRLARRLVAEALGTGLLSATAVGSGVMAERLAQGNAALALLAPVSGAHFNPVVSLALSITRRRLGDHAGACRVLIAAA